MSDLFPYGRCECDGPSCCRGRGPAAFRVIRNGKAMLVCTMCDTSSDKNKELLMPKDADLEVFYDFDPLGGICLEQYLKGVLKP